MGLDPNYTQAMSIAKEGRSLANSGKNKEAATKFKEALALLPDNPELLVRYGAVLMNTQDNEKALVEFQKAISSHLTIH
jgi:Flp pilus assembly protein TadD